ncbi:hypothetical protein G7Z17_g4564 [Cylindrodendrum hubeiense]|uniref:Uncharacterized protein n=1 Tax=Cylindrodendrum hubeiense TaxID=595255 RepID=A0A9P5LIR6_9HYPO|nr:hypothetical protein G7Z17_g4564 [Cylindrodendrum hubeiense]
MDNSLLTDDGEGITSQPLAADLPERDLAASTRHRPGIQQAGDSTTAAGSNPNSATRPFKKEMGLMARMVGESTKRVPVDSYDDTHPWRPVHEELNRRFDFIPWNYFEATNQPDLDEKGPGDTGGLAPPPYFAPCPPTAETQLDTTGGGDIASTLMQQNNAELPGPSSQSHRRPGDPVAPVSGPNMQKRFLYLKASGTGSGLPRARIALVMNQNSEWKRAKAYIKPYHHPGDGKLSLSISDHFASFLGFTQKEFKGTKLLQHHLGAHRIRCRSTINLKFQMTDKSQKKEDVGVWRSVEGEKVPFDVMIDAKFADQYTVSEDILTPLNMPLPLLCSDPRLLPAAALITQGNGVRIPEINYLAVTKAGAPFTDSGYGSIPNPNNSTNVARPRTPQKFEANQVTSDDSVTIYSTATAVSTQLAEQYVSEFCNELHWRLKKQVACEAWPTVVQLMPSLIKAFAIKLGYESSSPMGGNIMYFLHKHHQDIVTHLEAVVVDADENIVESHKPDEKAMSLFDKMNMWRESADKSITIHCGAHFEGVDDVDDEDIGQVDISAYNEVILSSAAYDWFITTVRQEQLIDRGGIEARAVVDKIRSNVLQRLPTASISKRRSAEPSQIGFRLQWQRLESRLKTEQARLGLSIGLCIPHAITVTGSADTYQAMPVNKYMHQIWPFSSDGLLQVIQRAADGSRGHEYSGTV